MAWFCRDIGLQREGPEIVAWRKRIAAPAAQCAQGRNVHINAAICLAGGRDIPIKIGVQNIGCQCDLSTRALGLQKCTRTRNVCVHLKAFIIVR